MKSHYNILTAFIAPVILLCVPAGCSGDGGGTRPSGGEREYVRMSGALPARSGQMSHTRAGLVSGPIDPDAYGLPPKQLDVGIITVNHVTADPVNDRPGYGEWAGQTADITRGFFGSNESGGLLSNDIVPTNGLIEYVDESGMYVQKAFYPEALNEYYYVKVFYPYQSLDMFMQMPDGTGAAAVFSDLTGHEDILCSNLGWGTQTQPVIETDYMVSNPDYVDPDSPVFDPEGDNPQYISILKFSHMLSQLRFWVVAENERAQVQYGKIGQIVVRFQPNKVVLRMMDDQTMRAADAVDTDFYLNFPDGVDSIDVSGVPISDPANGNNPQGTYAGCLMVMPDFTYRIEAKTSIRNWIGADHDFKVNGVAERLQPGKIYNITLKFMEAYKLDINMSEADEWWMDSVFD